MSTRTRHLLPVVAFLAATFLYAPLNTQAQTSTSQSSTSAHGERWLHVRVISTNSKGESMQMIIEPWAGGRWFRDRGNGIGHLWGHVQVIKPPVLLELSGPMFMSYPALNHVELRLDQIAGGTKVTLRHRAIGLLDSMHRENVGTGWRHYLDSIAKNFANGVAAHRA